MNNDRNTCICVFCTHFDKNVCICTYFIFIFLEPCPVFILIFYFENFPPCRYALNMLAKNCLRLARDHYDKNGTRFLRIRTLFLLNLCFYFEDFRSEFNEELFELIVSCLNHTNRFVRWAHTFWNISFLDVWHLIL